MTAAPGSQRCCCLSRPRRATAGAQTPCTSSSNWSSASTAHRMAPASASHRSRAAMRSRCSSARARRCRCSLPSGQEGGCKATYLSAELPLQRRLQDQTRNSTGSTGSNTASKAELASAHAPLRRRVRRLTGNPDAPARRAPHLDLAAQPAAAARPAPRTSPLRLMARTAGSRLAVGHLLGWPGFLVGWRVLDRRIRRKYGGLRIY